MNFNLIPFIGTDKIKLGMTTEEIQSILSKIPIRFKKSPLDKFLTDDYGFCQIYYDEAGKSEAFEFTQMSQVYFNDIPLISKSYDEVEKFFKNLDSELNYDGGCGFISLKYDIGIYSSTAPQGIVEAVLVAKQDYYKSAFGI